jgi:hypothetical protein
MEITLLNLAESFTPPSMIMVRTRISVGATQSISYLFFYKIFATPEDGKPMSHISSIAFYEVAEVARPTFGDGGS